MKNSILNALDKGLNILNQFKNDPENIKKIEECANLLANTFTNGGKVLICGNGGSAADAIHFAEEFTGNFRKKRKALPAIALTDTGHITCVANDFGFEYIFSRSVEAYGKKNDTIILLSTSGNSENIINAAHKAKEIGLKTISFLGKSGGRMKDISDLEFIIQANNSDRIQEIHMLILHILIEMTERILFPANYS